jgi:murein DD-endopeptidase MepM/ murein hydrolase activator NlpD
MTMFAAQILVVLTALAGVWPLHPRPQVVAGFTPPATSWSAGHRGVDLLGRPGQAVRAAAAGTVSFAGRIAGRGVVVVDHGPTRTTYEPVTATKRVGTRVEPADRIGTLESFGSHCWPRTCLHWGLVRLLPLYSAASAAGSASWPAPPGTPGTLARPPEVLAPRTVTVPWVSPEPTMGRPSPGGRTVGPWAAPPVSPWSAPPAGPWTASPAGPWAAPVG